MPHYKRIYEKTFIQEGENSANNAGVKMTSLSLGFPVTVIGRFKDLDNFKRQTLDQSFKDKGFRFLGIEEEILSFESVVPLTGSKDGGDSFTITGLNLLLTDKVEWVTIVDGQEVITDEFGFIVDNNTQITINFAVPKDAGNYRLRIHKLDDFDTSDIETPIVIT